MEDFSPEYTSRLKEDIVHITSPGVSQVNLLDGVYQHDGSRNDLRQAVLDLEHEIASGALRGVRIETCDFTERRCVVLCQSRESAAGETGSGGGQLNGPLSSLHHRLQSLRVLVRYPAGRSTPLFFLVSTDGETLPQQPVEALQALVQNVARDCTHARETNTLVKCLGIVVNALNRGLHVNSSFAGATSPSSNGVHDLYDASAQFRMGDHQDGVARGETNGPSVDNGSRATRLPCPRFCGASFSGPGVLVYFNNFNSLSRDIMLGSCEDSFPPRSSVELTQTLHKLNTNVWSSRQRSKGALSSAAAGFNTDRLDVEQLNEIHSNLTKNLGLGRYLSEAQVGIDETIDNVDLINGHFETSLGDAFSLDRNIKGSMIQTIEADSETDTDSHGSLPNPPPNFHSLTSPSAVDRLSHRGGGKFRKFPGLDVGNHQFNTYGAGSTHGASEVANDKNKLAQAPLHGGGVTTFVQHGIVIMPRVTLIDFEPVFPQNRELAKRYRLGSTTNSASLSQDEKLNLVYELCIENRACAALTGRRDLEQLWTLLALMTHPQILENDAGANGGGGVALHPRGGRILLQKLLSRYERVRDIQTLGTVACVLDNMNAVLNPPRRATKHSLATARTQTNGNFDSRPASSAKQPPKHKMRKIPSINTDGGWDDMEGYYGTFAFAGKAHRQTNDTIRSLLSPERTRRYDGYRYAYSELLYQWGMFVERAQVLQYIRTLEYSHQRTNSLQSTLDVAVRCRECNSLSESVVCNRCKPKGLIIRCAVCNVGVRGLVSFCADCGHGGHVEHMAHWFEHHQVCPVGCGCRCGIR